MQTYPHLSGNVLFKDTSQINGGRDTRISLAHYSILHYGKTWYERHFKAFPYDRPEVYHSEILNFQNTIKNTKPTLHIKHPKVQHEYQKSSNLNDFLKVMKDIDVYFYKDWCSPLIRQYVPQVNDMTWCINAYSLTLPNITATKLENEPNNLFIIKGGGNEVDISILNSQDPLLNMSSLSS
jgi:hypothetical protein